MPVGASNQILQAKLRIGAVDDPLEHEADRVADAVVSNAAVPPVGAAAAAIQPKCADCEAEEKTIRREAVREEDEDDKTIRAKAGPGGPQGDAALAASAVAGGGVPLPADARAYFEPRFGRDLSAVRIHADAGAQSAAAAIDARAFTLGRDIAFAPGEYDLSTKDGRRLIAHELAHVAQQSGPETVRRKVRVQNEVSLTSYFTASGIAGITESDHVYSRAKGGETSNVQSVLIPMLSSPREFNIDGADTETAVKNLKDHVAARLGVVTFASQKKYSFAALSGWSMNPQYYDWDTSKGTWKMKPGVDTQAARDDLNVHPEMYAIGCAAATSLTMRGGSKSSILVDMPSTDESDWVPGEAGYIENTKYAKGGRGIGYMGENIIFTGEGKFWGHFTGSAYHTLAEWKKMVEGWDGGAKVDSKRELPPTGLATLTEP
ncbi:MAG TPA: DUF4157 domain-containing protein [Beijerinckiaceae bacterium]|jgi:hypothetical protein